jgi:UDP-2,3-diacylglucosamine hydrolase
VTEKSIYFASDFHLGIPDFETSIQREKKIIQWLNQCSADAEAIYLVGDLFDFWFEYKKAVPKGFTRFLGTLAHITDSGLPVHVFTGNHDLWMFGYLEKECGVTLHTRPVTLNVQNKTILVGHGDGLGPGDYGYKFIKKVFTHPLHQFLFRQLHPDLGIRLASGLSKTSRNANYEEDMKFLGEDKEWLVSYCKKMLQKSHYDYFIFGHRHLPLEIALSYTSTYLNLGDWITHQTYVRLNKGKAELLRFM